MFRTRNVATEHIEHYPNGGIKCKYYTINGKKEGERLYYYENGNLNSKANYDINFYRVSNEVNSPKNNNANLITMVETK